MFWNLFPRLITFRYMQKYFGKHLGLFENLMGSELTNLKMDASDKQDLLIKDAN